MKWLSRTWNSAVAARHANPNHGGGGGGGGGEEAVAGRRERRWKGRSAESVCLEMQANREKWWWWWWG